MKRRFISLTGCIVFALFMFHYPQISLGGNLNQLIHLKQNLIIPDPAAKKDYILANIRSIQVDDQGNIYILDGKDHKVKVFTPNGIYLRVFGAEGQGPGEFQSPVNLFIMDGTLSVFDFGNKRMSYYSLDGHHLKDISLHELGGFFRPEAEDETSLYGNLIEWESDGSQWLKLVKYDKTTRLVSTISKVKNDVIYPKENPLADTFRLRIRSDRFVVWAYQKNYVIFLTSKDGKIVKQISKKYCPMKISAEDKDRVINMRYGGKSKIPPNFNLVWPEYFSPISDIIVGDNDWLYVRTNEENSQKEIKYDVFDENGNFRGSFYHKQSIRLIKNNMAYAITENAEGFPIIKRFEISRRKTL